MAIALALPAQALITNADIAGNAGISYSKLKLSKKITSKDIKDGTIKGDDIDDEAIDTDQLADDAVTSDKIADGTITVSDIAAGTLTATTLADGSVTSAKILDGTIVAADIATSGVATAEILNGTILGEDLAANIAISTTGSVATTGTITSAGLMTASGGLTVVGDLKATPQSAAATAAEGVVYYDSDDDNLYVYANGGWVDLTAGASGAPTLDDAYNASSGASTVLVDNGALTLQSNDTTAGGGDIIVNLNDAGDFQIQNAGTAFATFDDSGNVALTGTLDVIGNVSDSTGTFTIDDAANITGAATLDGAVTLGNADTDVVTVTGTIAGASPLIFEGVTANDFETTIAVTDPTADNVITLPNVTGTVITTGDTASVTGAMIAADTVASGDIAADTIAAGDIATSAVTTDEILDATIAGGDLAANIAITTTGNQAFNGDTTIGNTVADKLTINAIIQGSTGLMFEGNTVDGVNYTDIAVADPTQHNILTLPNNTGSLVSTGDTNSVTSAMIAANVVAADDIATSAVTTTEILDGTIATADIAADQITSALIATNVIVAADIATGAVLADEIGDDVVDGADLADTITLDAAFALNGQDVTIGEDLAVNGDEIDADGTLDVTGATGLNLNTGAGAVVIDPAGSGNVNPGADSTDSLGADATRWATIFADTLNYSTAVTDSNSGDNVSTVTLGNAADADVVNITAKTAINSEHWDVTEPGAAEFISVGAVTPGTGTFTTLIGDTVQADTTVSFSTNSDSIANTTDDTFTFTREDSGTVTITAADDGGAANITIDAGGAGAITLGSADVTSLTVTTDGTGTDEVALPAGSIDSTEILDESIVSADIDDGTIAGGDLAATIAITTSGTLTSTGTVDFSGASLIVDSGLTAAIPETCTTGQLFVATDGAVGSRLMVCTATNTWSAN